MRSVRWTIFTGVGLILVGLLLLLDALHLPFWRDLLWPVIFGIGAIAFLTVFARSRESWWAAIPGFVLLGLCLTTALSRFWPGAGDVPASLFFLCLAGGFGAVHLRDRDNWWALIPAGVMLTLAVVVALPPQMDGMPSASILFLGLAATFMILASVPLKSTRKTGDPLSDPTVDRRMWWPLIPGTVLGAMGVVFALQAATLLPAANYLTPLALLLAGIILVVHSMRTRTHSIEQRRAGRQSRQPPVGGRPL
jgi:hypothetical protein